MGRRDVRACPGITKRTKLLADPVNSAHLFSSIGCLGCTGSNVLIDCLTPLWKATAGNVTSQSMKCEALQMCATSENPLHCVRVHGLASQLTEVELHACGCTKHLCHPYVGKNGPPLGYTFLCPMWTRPEIELFYHPLQSNSVNISQCFTLL